MERLDLIVHAVEDCASQGGASALGKDLAEAQSCSKPRRHSSSVQSVINLVVRIGTDFTGDAGETRIPGDCRTDDPDGVPALTCYARLVIP